MAMTQNGYWPQVWAQKSSLLALIRSRPMTTMTLKEENRNFVFLHCFLLENSKLFLFYFLSCVVL